MYCCMGRASYHVGSGLTDILTRPGKLVSWLLLEECQQKGCRKLLPNWTLAFGIFVRAPPALPLQAVLLRLVLALFLWNTICWIKLVIYQYLSDVLPQRARWTQIQNTPFSVSCAETVPAGWLAKCANNPISSIASSLTGFRKASEGC